MVSASSILTFPDKSNRTPVFVTQESKYGVGVLQTTKAHSRSHLYYGLSDKKDFAL